MLNHVSTAGHAIARRLVDEPINLKFPPWAGLIALGDFIIFFPIFLFLGYTIGNIFPTLAIVEDPNPPAYEPVALDESATDQGPETSAPGKPITTSLRATHRLLGSVAGWRSYFRGIVCAAVLSIAEGMLGNVFKKFLPVIPIGALLAQLALTQLGAAWTHIVISAPSKKKFYQRLPPFKKTFEATCFPILAIWLANAVSVAIPILVGKALGLVIPGKPENPEDPQPPFDGNVIWKSLIVFVLAITLHLVTFVPANVLLVRVQASLLPPDEDTIIPFDRSFGGKVDPVVVDGKGFVSMRDALTTFPRASWIRLYKLYAKIVGLSFGVYILAFAVIIPEIFLIVAKSEKTPSF